MRFARWRILAPHVCSKASKAADGSRAIPLSASIIALPPSSKPTARFTRACAPSSASTESRVMAARSAAHYSPSLTMRHVPTRGCRRAPNRSPRCRSAFVAIPATWLIFDHFTHLLTIWTSDGDMSTLERRIDGYVDRLLAAKPSFPGPLRATGPISASLDRRRYLELVDAVKRRIFEGDVYQLQLGIRFGAAFEGEAFDLYRALRRQTRRRICFTSIPPFGRLLGASPEFLVRLEGRRARLRPLAGTRSRGRDDDEDARLPRSCSSTKKSVRSMSCSSISDATTLARSASTAA